MLITPTKEQLIIIKEKSFWWRTNYFRTWILRNTKRIWSDVLKKYWIKLTKEQEVCIRLGLTEEQQEKLQAERLLCTIGK